MASGVGDAAKPVDQPAHHHDRAADCATGSGTTSDTTFGIKPAVDHQVGRLMPSTVAEVDASYQFDWTRWPVPTMPDVLVEPWAGVPGCFWTEDITARKVDTSRTNALPAFDVPINAHGGDAPWQGSSYGMPFQLIDSAGPTTPVWDQSQPIRWNWFVPTFPIVKVPLPNVVRREGDPNGSSDLHWTGYDPARRVLWEIITLRKTPRFLTWGQADWIASYGGGGVCYARWDCSKPWNAAGQARGVVAGCTPKFPLICRFDETARAIATGDPDASLSHAVFGVLPNYGGGLTGPARGTDGNMPGHPVQAGARLRLPWHRAREFKAGTPARILANTLARRGWVQLDRNDSTITPKVGQGKFSLSMDSRWVKGAGPIVPLAPLNLRLSDFEVVI